MSVKRSFHPEVRLKAVMAQPGGIPVSQAVRQAESNVESIRDHCITAIDVKIAEIVQAAATFDETKRAYLYERANEIFGEAGALKLEELSQAAHSLCCLLCADEVKKLDQSVRVHATALSALRRPELSQDVAARKAVLAGLRGLSAQKPAA